MSKAVSKPKLNDSQVELLQLLYKYRFGTRELLGKSLGITVGSSLYERLKVLKQYGYIGERLDIRARGINKTYAYYVTATGLKALQSLDDLTVSDRAIKLSYQNKDRIGEGYIAHVLNIFAYTQRLKQQYPELKIFTERDMERYSYFPERAPDAFLSLPSSNLDLPQRFFFDIVRDRVSRRAIDVQLSNYNEFFDEGGWDETDSPLPAILLVCEWSPDERIILRRVQGLINRLGSDMRVFVSTAPAVLGNSTAAIWTDVNDPDEVVKLNDISVNP